MAALIALLILCAGIGLGVFFSGGYTTLDAPTPSRATSTEPAAANKETSVETSITLDYSGKNLSQFPKEILSQKNTEKLDLSDNALTGALPAEIHELQNLQILDISNNQMTGLPAELGHLSHLRILDASNNRLTGLPYELGDLANLEILDLTGNAVSTQDLEIIRAKLPPSTQIRY